MSEATQKQASLPLFSAEGEKIDDIAVSGSLFAAPVKPHLLHAAVEGYRTSARQGTASSKTRSEVQASGAKLYRQKGTGRARAGARSSPTRVGGGVAFGPHPRKFDKRITKRLKRQALSGALTSRAASGDIRVVESLKLDSISTQTLARMVAALGLEEALKADKPVALLVIDRLDKNLALSARNIRGVRLGRAEDLNAFDVLKYRHLVVTKEGLARLQEVFS